MSAISGLGGASSDVVGASAGAFGDLSSDEFITIMIEELTNQDPFNPNDSQALLEQLSSLRQIESDLALQENMQALVQQNALSSASGFLGQVIEGVNEFGTQSTGRVETLEIENGQAILKLADGSRVPSSGVTSVANISSLSEETTQVLLANMLAMDSARLIGTKVQGVNNDQQDITGIVTGVRLDGVDALLELDTGKQLRASSVSKFLPLDS